MLVPGPSIAENIMLDRLADPGRPSAGRGFGSWRARRHAAGRGADVRRSLIAAPLLKNSRSATRALSHHCRFLILDEPTAPLDQHESERLFAVVRRPQQQGIGVVFISHRIHELKAIRDT